MLAEASGIDLVAWLWFWRCSLGPSSRPAPKVGPWDLDAQRGGRGRRLPSSLVKRSPPQA